ncbi:MAG: Solute-binding protein [candidate division NC10 bacterium]|nr:Solute-binding protein [candidate division NC10 bacterium]
MIARILIAWCVAAAVLFLSPPPGSTADLSLKLGVVTPAQHPHSISAREYAKLVTERTKGRVEVKVFDNASLGSNPELLDGVKTGAIDMCVNTPGIMAEYHPVTGLLELPYLFASKEHRRGVTEGPVGDEIARTYAEKTGIQIIGYFGGAQRNMITRAKAIKSIEDLKSLKMRTWESKVMLDWWKALGAVGAVIAFQEVYTALQTGVVDGAENEFTTFMVSRWSEVAKNIALTQHDITVRPLAISQKSLAKLPGDLRDILIKAGRDAATYDVKLEGELDEKNMAALKEKYNVVYATPDKKPFIERSRAVIQEYAKSKGLEPIAQKIFALAK